MGGGSFPEWEKLMVTTFKIAGSRHVQRFVGARKIFYLKFLQQIKLQCIFNFTFISALILCNFETNFIISLFQASTCFEHMWLSSGGQNCAQIVHNLYTGRPPICVMIPENV